MQRKPDPFERLLISSDHHAWFLDKPSWKIFLQVCEDYHPDRVILNGDILDCASISEHVKKIEVYNSDVLEEYTFDEELAIAQREIFAPLRKALGKDPKILMRLGNHEMRFLHPNRANAQALAEIIETCRKRRSEHLEDLLKLDKYGATLSYKSVDVLYNTFSVIHGVKTGPGAPKANLLRYGSGTSGHDHRANCFTQVVRNSLNGWWTSGCMRKIKNVEYLPFGDQPDWANAFLSLTINKNTGHFFCKTHFIIDGQCEFNGKIYTA